MKATKVFRNETRYAKLVSLYHPLMTTAVENKGNQLLFDFWMKGAEYAGNCCLIKKG